MTRLRRVSAPVATRTRAFGGHTEKIEVKTPGAKDQTVPDMNDQGVGRAYQDFVAAKTGQAEFFTEPVFNKFGTFEEPVFVPSAHESRVVGCNGGNGFPHDLVFFELTEGPKHMCELCGQFFQMFPVKDDSPHHEH